MAQFYDYSSTIHKTNTDIALISTFGSVQKTSYVTIDGSVETNFKAACWAHYLAFTTLLPSSTSPACYVSFLRRWVVAGTLSTLATPTTPVKVPSGNSGVLTLYGENPNIGTTVMKYKVNSGSYTSFTDGTDITVVDGDVLSFQITDLDEQDFVNGRVIDKDTGVQLDVISIMNTTPIP